jgi:hypothetical protein
MSSKFDLCLLLCVIRLAGWLKHCSLSLSLRQESASVVAILSWKNPFTHIFVWLCVKVRYVHIPTSGCCYCKLIFNLVAGDANKGLDLHE